MKKLTAAALSALLLIVFCCSAWAARPVRKRIRTRNDLPAAWRYEAGYTLWRMNRKEPVNFHTYKRYRNDMPWHAKMRAYYRTQELLLNTTDWTIEELTLFLQRNQEYLKFHPAGYDD